MRALDVTPGAVVFDKDGTLLDFHRTWDRAVGATLEDLARDPASLRGAAAAVGYDLQRSRVEPDSPIIAESNATIMAILEPWLDTTEFEERLARQAATSATPTPGAARLVRGLSVTGVPIGLVTNDSEVIARRQLAHLGWSGCFAAVVGYDSGFGAKPDPGPLNAVLEIIGGDPDAAIMVGDSDHDRRAAASAGVPFVHVGAVPRLVGHADAAVSDLVELADRLGL